MKIGKLLLVAGMLALASLACTLSGDDAAAVATAVSQTESALTLTAAAVPSETPAPSATPLPSATATLQQTAPDPLPSSHTGFNMNTGECFDYDTGLMLSAPDGECDIWLAESVLLKQVNKAQTSGYTTFTPPSLSACQSAQYDPNDLAVQTDLYMCFTSNQGNYGFIVARGYLGSVPFTGIVFDYWLYQ